MLSPKRTKFRKQQRGRMKGRAMRNNKVAFGEYGLQVQECGWLTSRQLEATRRTMTRYTNVAEKFGLKFFQINQSRRVPQNLVWDLVKVHPSIGSRLLNPVT